MSCLTSILLVVIMLVRRSGQLAPLKRSRWSAPEREVRKLWALMTFGWVVSSECPVIVHLSLDSQLSTISCSASLSLSPVLSSIFYSLTSWKPNDYLIVFVFPQTLLLNSFSILTPCNCSKVVRVVVNVDIDRGIRTGRKKVNEKKVCFN